MADDAEQFALPDFEVDVLQSPQRSMIRAAIAIRAAPTAEGRAHHAFEHLAESEIAGMQSADAVAFAHLLDCDHRLHRRSSDHVGESRFKATAEIDGADEQYKRQR